MSRFQSFERSTSARSATCSLFEFYREEFLKHQRCIHAQRECFSERAICDVEAALTRILTELDRLCAQQDGAQVVSRLLQKIDTLTGLSAMSDPKQVH